MLESEAEKKIIEALERGDFDNLPGMGRPLQLEHDRFVPPEFRLAYRIMRDYNTQPEWIAVAKSIAEELEQTRQHLLRAAHRFRTILAHLDGKYDIDSIHQRLNARDQWRHDQAWFRDAVHQLNKKIALLNLKVPSYHLTRDLLDAEQELARLEH